MALVLTPALGSCVTVAGLLTWEMRTGGSGSGAGTWQELMGDHWDSSHPGALSGWGSSHALPCPFPPLPPDIDQCGLQCAG